MKKKLYLVISFLLIFLVIHPQMTFAQVGDPVSPESPPEGWNRFHYSDENITYEGGPWIKCNPSDCTTNKYGTSGAIIKFNFVGKQFNYNTNTWNTSSKSISVFIDGKKVDTFSLYGPNDTTMRVMYVPPLQSNSEHFVEIVNNTTDYLHLHSIDISDNGYLKPYNPSIPENPKPNPDPTPKPSGDRAILTITMTTGLEKEFDLSMDEVKSFINWYDAKDAGTGPSKYAIDKHNNNRGPFNKRTDYVIFNNILTFEVDEYSSSNK